MTQKRALVIDDEPDITTYFASLLSDHGWEVRTANDPNEGLAMAKEDVPDIILLDVMMPERGGLSTLVALRKDEKTKAIPVILVTGVQETLTQDYRAFLDRFKHHRPEGYLEKPVDPDELLRLVDELTSTVVN